MPRPLGMKVNINCFICVVSVIGEEMNADTQVFCTVIVF